MKPTRLEAKAIARLLAEDRNKTVAWIYQWDTFELSIYWLDRATPPTSIDPPLSLDILDRATSVTSDEVTDLLRGMLKEPGTR